MDRFMQRQLGRREVLRRTALGAGAAGLAFSGAGRIVTSAWAQDATPAAGGFDAAACYQSFAGSPIVQYEKLADPPYNIGLSNSYIGNVWRTQMIKMALAYSKTADIAPLISEFQVNTADRDDAAQQAAIENMISNGAQAIVILAHTPTALVQTVQQARADGIVIVSFDTTVQTDPPDPSIDLGTTVNEDQVEMGRTLAEFLVEQTGGKGKILMVNGVQGTGVDAGALHAIDHQDLALAAGLLDQKLGERAAHFDLILVDRGAEIDGGIRRIGLDGGIERNDDDAVSASLLHGLHQRRRRVGQNDDRLGAVRDHVLDGGLLRGVVAVGGIDLELADQRGNVRRLGVGQGHLDHLGAPDVADVRVGKTDVVRRVGELLILHDRGAGEGLIAGGGIEATCRGSGILGPGRGDDPSRPAEREPGRPGAERGAAKHLTTTQLTLHEAIHLILRLTIDGERARLRATHHEPAPPAFRRWRSAQSGAGWRILSMGKMGVNTFGTIAYKIHLDRALMRSSQQSVAKLLALCRMHQSSPGSKCGDPLAAIPEAVYIRIYIR